MPTGKIQMGIMYYFNKHSLCSPEDTSSMMMAKQKMIVIKVHNKE